MTIINAFHPDYVKTYHPELLSRIKTEEQQKNNGLAVAKKTPMKMKSIKLERTEFHVFSKAGTKNTTKTKKVK